MESQPIDTPTLIQLDLLQFAILDTFPEVFFVSLLYISASDDFIGSRSEGRTS